MIISRSMSRSIVVLKGIIELNLANKRNCRSRKGKGLRREIWLWSNRKSSAFWSIEHLSIVFSPSSVQLRSICIHINVILIYSLQIDSHNWEERPSLLDKLGNQCSTVAVDNGLLSSLHTVSLKRSKSNWCNTPFVEKEEARKIGLCRRVHLGLQCLRNQNTISKQEESISSYIRKEKV